MVRIRRSEDNLWELFLFFYHKFQGQNLGLYVEAREQNGEFSSPFYHVYSGDGTQVVQLAGKPKHSVFLYSQYPELYRMDTEQNSENRSVWTLLILLSEVPVQLESCLMLPWMSCMGNDKTHSSQQNP